MIYSCRVIVYFSLSPHGPYIARHFVLAVLTDTGSIGRTFNQPVEVIYMAVVRVRVLCQRGTNGPKRRTDKYSYLSQTCSELYSMVVTCYRTHGFVLRRFGNLPQMYKTSIRLSSRARTWSLILVFYMYSSSCCCTQPHAVVLVLMLCCSS